MLGKDKAILCCAIVPGDCRSVESGGDEPVSKSPFVMSNASIAAPTGLWKGKSMEYPRRTFLMGTGMASLALLGSRALASGPASACYDADAVPSGQAELRRSLEYTDHSPDPAKLCERCAFSTFAKGPCGTCQMFSGGPVSPSGVCNSFAAKG